MSVFVCTPAVFTVERSRSNPKVSEIGKLYGRPSIRGGGAPVGSESLCRTCTNAQMMTGFRESEQITMCDNVPPEPRRPVRDPRMHGLLRQESSEL